MVVTFDKEYLKELYEFGKANDKSIVFNLISYVDINVV